MKKRYDLPVLPENMILFIDNCAFSLHDYKKVYASTNNHRYSIGYIKEEYSRLEKLIEKLSKIDNWTTISAVINEFKLGNIRFSKLTPQILKSRQLYSAFQRLLKQRKKALGLLEDDYRIVNKNLNNTLIKRIQEIHPIVENIFQKLEKQYTKTTDIELITTALAYAIDDPVCIFAHDKNLLKAYSICTIQKGLSNNSHILTDEIGKTINVLEYKT